MTGRLKVAMVALDFHREGGSEGRTGHLVDRLVAEGHEVHLVGARIRGAWNAETVLRPLPTPRHPHWLEVLLFGWRAQRLIARQRFDIVHNQIRPFVPGLVTVGGGCHRYYVRDVLPRERGGLRGFLKGNGPLHRVLLALERAGFRADRCPFIITNSCLSRDGILKYYPFPPERIVVAYNGVDAKRFSPATRAHLGVPCRQALGIDPDDLVVLMVGSGFARKGLGPLLEALGLLASRRLRLHLVVVGGRPTRDWRQRVGRLGLGRQVSFVGQVPDPEAYYAAADVFALPTFFDPFANATLEAMASGLPVITTRQNGAAEVMHAGADGLVLERAEDVHGLAEALASLRDLATRMAMGERARETALKYGWDNPLEATLRVYRQVMEERAEAPQGIRGAGAPRGRG